MTKDDELLAARHVLGLLDSEDELRATTRMTDDPEFAAAVAVWSERLDALDAPDEVSPPADLWARIQHGIDDTVAAPDTRTLRAGDGVWELLGPGIERRILHIDRTAGTQSYYVRMRAGAVLPLHSHSHTEQCVLLNGILRIGDTTFEQGDFHLGNAGADHLPITAETDALFFIHGGL